jgi:hypothetical protein
MFDWQIALGLELLAVLFAFFLWFKAAKAEAGPRKLAKVVAVVIIIFATLLVPCTLAKAIINYSEYKAATYGAYAGAAADLGRCPGCGAVHGEGPGRGIGRGSCISKGRGFSTGKAAEFPCPRAEKLPPATAEAGTE